MGEQMAHGDLRRHVLVRIVRQVLAERIVQRSLPASTSCSVAIAVNILFIDPMRNCVSGVFGTFRLAVGEAPRILEQNLPFRATSTAPENWSFFASFSARAESAASASASVIRRRTRSRALAASGVSGSSTRLSASAPIRSRRMSSTPTRSGPRLSVCTRRRRTVWPAQRERSMLTSAGSRVVESPATCERR